MIRSHEQREIRGGAEIGDAEAVADELTARPTSLATRSSAARVPSNASSTARASKSAMLRPITCFVTGNSAR
jgi:hypothetical protein